MRDLYALYPDYLIDIAVEQAALAAAQARRLAAADPLVQHAAAPEALARRRARLRLGLRSRRQRAARQGPVAGREHRRPRGLVPPRQLQPLLLRRLPAALRADRGAVRHALPAAARPARRAQGERGRARRPRRDLRAAARRLSRLARDRPGRGLRRLRGAAERAPDRSRRWKPPDGAQRLADRQPDLPRRRGDRGAARALPRPRLDHRLPRRRHPDRPVGAEARDAARGHAAVRRVRRRPDALPGRPRARAAAALVAEEAHLRLGQRPAVRLGAAARPRRARLRHRLAPRASSPRSAWRCRRRRSASASSPSAT